MNGVSVALNVQRQALVFLADGEPDQTIVTMSVKVYTRNVAIRSSQEALMLTDYIAAALHNATYKILEDGSYWGEIPALPGLWGSGPTLEACREDLHDVIQDWLLFAFKLRRIIPVINGIDLNATASV